MTRTASIKIGVAQIRSELGDVAANLDNHLGFIARARARHVDCLLFPEMSLTGHSTGPITLDLALRREDPRLDALARAAGPMYTVVGLIEEGPAAQFYNTALVLRHGRLVFQHRKINLATFGRLEEGKHFAAGRYVETFGIESGWRAGLLICNDLWNPALVYLAALHGSTLLLAPTSSAREAVGAEFDNPSGWDLAGRFYATIYGMPLVFANRVGVEHDLAFWGGSRILDAFGRTVVETGDQEDLIVAELSFDDVRRARYRLPTVRDSNLALIAREVQRLETIIGVPETLRPP